MDRLSPERRSRLMARVKGKDTAPELIVRRLLREAGYGYRLHRKDLPGKPDLVFASRRKVVFVHGCFWHGHGCKIGRLPKSKPEFWQPKIARNRERDAATIAELKAIGWDSLVVWQCETRDIESLRPRIEGFLGESRKSRSTLAEPVATIGEQGRRSHG